ncbi:MAG: hypothetical protein AAGG69_13285 [Pseudomonadota bacterium]
MANYDGPKGSADRCEAHAPITSKDLTPHQTNALSIMRCYFMSYTAPKSCAWEAGMETAVRAYGTKRGPHVAWACLKCVQEMRVSRKTTFNFCNPFCKCCRKRLTQNEQHLLESLDHAGTGAVGALSLTSMMLCEGNEDSGFINSLHELDDAMRGDRERATLN